MAEARSLVFPRAIALGARPLAVPGSGSVLAVSAFYPFRLSDGASILPATWYEIIASHVGPEVVPDSMAPVPGAELLVLGAVPHVASDRREASVRCGSLSGTVVLRPDPERPGMPFVPDCEAAIWHEQDNPAGRGGPDDGREPLILAKNEPDRPVWFGPTPFDHPLRLRRVGVPDASSGTGWPSDADPAVLYESHPAWWVESFSPGDPLEVEGLGARPLQGRLPPYRITITSGREDGRFLVEPARIQGVTLIPEADAGAVFWRVAIDVGDDILGESVQALVAALEDADSPPRDAEHWGRIAVNRWLEPDTAMDDRPLLPAALAATVTLPFAMPEDDPMSERLATAEAWMKNEVGMEDTNPFEALAPDEQLGLAEQAVEASQQEDAPPDRDAIEEIATSALAASRQRHADAGFKERSPEEQKEPEVRGARLEGEIAQRLSGPYQSPQDRLIVGTIRDHRVDGMDPDDVMQRLATARQMNPDPALAWPPLDDDEARRFGDAVYEHLERAHPVRHVDVAGVAVVADLEERADRRVVGRHFDGLFAEDTVWQGLTFFGCEFVESSLCRSRFTDCTFRDCEFRDTNLSKAELAGCRFINCRFASLRAVEPTWFESRFERCRFEDVSLTDAAMRDSTFAGGSWKKIDISDALLMDIAFREMALEEVTLAEVMAPRNVFERVSLTKVWMMSKGPAGSTFEDVEAVTCGFLGNVRFDQSTFSRVRFAMTGFTGAVFSATSFTPDCRFDGCDLSGAIFDGVRLDGVRFLECSMTGTRWARASAANAWFFGALLRGVDFGDTELRNAVFADADLEGTKFLPDKTIGADFQGTVQSGS